MTKPAPSSRWGHRAACAGRTSPDPSLPGVSRWLRQDVALDYCRACPVIRECAADAVEHRDTAVIRAGLYIPITDTAKRAARRRLRAIRDGRLDPYATEADDVEDTA